MTRRFCDKCGKEVPEHYKDNLKISKFCDIDTAREHEPANFVTVWDTLRFDICKDCAEEIVLSIQLEGAKHEH